MKPAIGILAFVFAGAFAAYATRMLLLLSLTPTYAASTPMAEVDLGEVPGGAVVTLNLEFRNLGYQSVTFDQVEGGCSCVNLGDRAFTIAPRSSFALPVRLDLRSKSGAGVTQIRGTPVGSTGDQVIGIIKYKRDPVRRVWVIPQGDGGAFMPGSEIDVLVYTNDPDVPELESANQVVCTGDSDMDFEVVEARSPQVEHTGEFRLLCGAHVRIDGLFEDLKSNLTVTLPASLDGVTLSITAPISFSSGIVIRPHWDKDALVAGLEIVDCAAGDQYESGMEPAISSAPHVKGAETVLAVLQQPVGDGQALPTDLEIHARGERVQQRICPRFWRILAERW